MNDPIPEEETVVAEIVESHVEDPAIDLPEDPDEAIAQLLGQLRRSQQDATSYLDDLKRVAADFDNYRRRMIKEQATLVDRAAERIVRQLLPALDSLDAALSLEPSSEAEKQLHHGISSTREQMLESLAKEGLEPIAALGEPFDPELHEAVGAPGGNGTLVVSQELRRGYRLNGRLIRAALVVLESKE